MLIGVLGVIKSTVIFFQLFYETFHNQMTEKPTQYTGGFVHNSVETEPETVNKSLSCSTYADRLDSTGPLEPLWYSQADTPAGDKEQPSRRYIVMNTCMQAYGHHSLNTLIFCLQCWDLQRKGPLHGKKNHYSYNSTYGR